VSGRVDFTTHRLFFSEIRRSQYLLLPLYAPFLQALSALRPTSEPICSLVKVSPVIRNSTCVFASTSPHIKGNIEILSCFRYP